MGKGPRRKKAAEATVLFYQSEDVKDRWVAHYLEFDLIGTGDNPGEAFTELLGTLEANIQLWEELGDRAVPPQRAPKAYWDLLEKAIPLPALDIGGLKGWAEKYFQDRRKKLAQELKKQVPQKCRAAALVEASELVGV